jgi:hypothetical protein
MKKAKFKMQNVPARRWRVRLVPGIHPEHQGQMLRRHWPAEARRARIKMREKALEWRHARVDPLFRGSFAAGLLSEAKRHRNRAAFFEYWGPRPHREWLAAIHSQRPAPIL